MKIRRHMSTEEATISMSKVISYCLGKTHFYFPLSSEREEWRQPVHLWPSITRIGSASLHVHLILFPLVPRLDGLPQNKCQVSSGGAWVGFISPEVASPARKIFLGGNSISYSCLWRALCKIPAWRWAHFNANSAVRELKWTPRRHLKIGQLWVQFCWLVITSHLQFTRSKLRGSLAPA